MIREMTQALKNSNQQVLGRTFVQDTYPHLASGDQISVTTKSTPDRVIRRLRVQELAGNISRAQIYAMLDPKSSAYDKTFPLPFQLGVSANSPVVWWESEIINWLLSKALSRKSVAGFSA